MARSLQPVSIAGIEGDALISEDVSYTTDIPEYPIENGYNVSDTIILKPFQLNITMFISDSPATWRYRSGHSPSAGRTKQTCKKLEDLYFKRELVKVVTSDKIYTSMGITSIVITHSTKTGYSRQVQLSLKKVYVTQRKTVYIPSDLLQSGDSEANAGVATTSSTSSSSTSASTSEDSGSKSSILYGVASSLGFL
jgi:hypothetical protein